jgi:hypothetical protein
VSEKILFAIEPAEKTMIMETPAEGPGIPKSTGKTEETLSNGGQIPPNPLGLRYQIETLTPHEIEVRVSGGEPGAQEIAPDRHYQITGANLKRLNDYAMTLKFTWKTPEGFDKFFLSDLNLARAKSRHDFITEAKDYLFISEDILRADLFLLIGAVEKLQRENIKRLEDERTTTRRTFAMKEDEERKAVEYLSKHDVLTECLHSDLEKLGYAGDELGKDVLYIAASSRKLPKPISVLSVANSAAGKSFGQEVVSSLLPADEVYSYTRLSPKSLSHYGRYDLAHKAFYLDELVGSEDEGSSQLRAMLSRGYMTTAYASVDPQTGKVATLEREVHGPIALFTSTTHEELIDDETRSRFLILPVDESQEQTERVMKSMIERSTEAGILADGERRLIRRKYQLIQKVLKPVSIAVPEAWKEKIRFNSERISHKRKFEGYLSFVYAICFHRQYQRERKSVKDPVSGKEVEIVHVTAEDILHANSVMERLFAASLGELNPVNRRMLSDIETWCKTRAGETGLPLHEIPFTRRDIREGAHWEHVPCRRAFEKLYEMEYIERSFGKERARAYYRLSLGSDGKVGGKGDLKLWSPGDEG